jgi:Fe-S cluster assembly iron-binding protein IscA
MYPRTPDAVADASSTRIVVNRILTYTPILLGKPFPFSNTNADKYS